MGETIYLAAGRTMLVPTGVIAGSPTTSYRAERRKLHAVASTRGVLERETAQYRARPSGTSPRRCSTCDAPSALRLSGSNTRTNRRKPGIDVDEPRIPRLD
jgi:hypothetical protein